MEFEEISQVWRDQTTGTIKRTRTEDLSLVLERAKRTGAARRRRFTRLSWIVAVPLVLFFGYAAWQAPNIVSASGAILIAGVAAFVAVRYRAIGRRMSDTALPVRQALEAEVAHLDALSRLRRDAPWVRTIYWVGFGVYVLGVVTLEQSDPRPRTLSVGLYVLLLVVAEGMIHFARRRGPGPTRTLKDELSSWLDNLNDLDEQEAGNPAPEGRRS